MSRPYLALSALSLLFFVITAGSFTSLGVVLPEMVVQLHWDWSQAGLGYTVLGVACGLASLAPALVIRRLGVRGVAVPRRCADGGGTDGVRARCDHRALSAGRGVARRRLRAAGHHPRHLRPVAPVQAPVGGVRGLFHRWGARRGGRAAALYFGQERGARLAWLLDRAGHPHPRRRLARRRPVQRPRRRGRRPPPTRTRRRRAGA